MRPYQLDPLFAGVGALPGIGPKTVPLYDKLLGDAGLTCEAEGRDVIEMLADLPDLWDVNISGWANDSATSRSTENDW